MPDKAIDVFKRTKELNTSDPLREGNIICLPPEGRLIITGDLHGNVWAFEQITAYADLAANPNTHIVFHEIIHGGPSDASGCCLSFKLLQRAAAYKLEYPGNVHFVMGNHDVSAIKESDVLRDGKEMTTAFSGGLQNHFGEKADMVNLAMKQMLFSQALAARTPTGVQISHSLPADRYEEDFDTEFLERQLKITDLNRPNSAYTFLWGRDQSPQLLERLADKFGVKLFVVGHQRQEEGFKRVDPNMLILACDHSNGCIADIDLARSYSLDELCGCVKKLYDLA